MSGTEEQGGGSWLRHPDGRLERVSGTVSHPEGDAPRDAAGQVIGQPLPAPVPEPEEH